MCRQVFAALVGDGITDNVPFIRERERHLATHKIAASGEGGGGVMIALEILFVCLGVAVLIVAVKL